MLGAKFHIIKSDGRIKTVERTISEKEYLAAKEIVETYRKQQIKKFKRQVRFSNRQKVFTAF